MSDLQRVTLNLSPRTQEALGRVTALTGDSKTDSVNRALALYDWVTAREADKALLFVRYEDGREERVVLL